MQMVDRARRSVALNNLEDRVTIVEGDLREISRANPARRADLVVANPPFRIARSGRVSQDEERAAARHELAGGLEVFLGKYFVDSPQETGADDFGTPELRENVLGGVYMIGMTKEQVYACLGPPYKIDQDTPAVGLGREEILASDHWVYPESWLLVVPDCADFYFGDGLLQKRVP